MILRFSSIPIFIFSLIIIFPWGGNLQIAKNIENIIEGKDFYKVKNYKFCQNFFFILKLIFLGPFITRERYQLINFSTKIIMFIATLYPLILPNNIFKPIYGLYGYSFFVFVVIGKRIGYDEWALEITFGYYITVIMINAIYLGGYKYYNSGYKNGVVVHIINLFLNFVFWGGGLFLNIRFVGESIWWPYLFLTPIYVVIPIILKLVIHLKTNIISNSVELSKYYKKFIEEKMNKNGK